MAVASSERSLAALYELRSDRRDDHVWSFWTVRTEGTWEEPGKRSSFDSAAPTDADPWPLTLQHLVASVPAEVRMGPAGAPEALVDPDGWTTAARAAVYGSTLPVEALAGAEPLFDPTGVVEDLARSFPGVPPEDGAWDRTERIAGVAAHRVEQCAVEIDGPNRTWDCRGAVVGPSGGPARLHEVESWTRMVADRDGLRSLDAGYQGTLVMVGPDGRTVFDRPIAGRRRVERR